VVDPSFRTISLIVDLVQAAGDRAALVDLNAVAQRAKPTIGQVRPYQYPAARREWATATTRI
jgi:hypothetical protein